METPKRQLLILAFTTLCLNKAFLSNISVIIIKIIILPAEDHLSPVEDYLPFLILVAQCDSDVFGDH